MRTTKIIDNIVDQSEDGLEVLRGSSTYTYEGNWKLTAENGADGYHVGTVHWNYLSTMGQRNYEKGGTEAVDAKSWSAEGGFYSFENGHMMLWTRLLNPEVRPIFSQLERLQKTYGEARAGFHRAHHQESVPVPERVPDGPVLDPDPGHPADRRQQDRGHHLRLRSQERAGRACAPSAIRQYEDFINVTGMGTPDDLEEFRALPERLRSPRHALERHEPRRGALDRWPGRARQPDRHENPP